MVQHFPMAPDSSQFSPPPPVVSSPEGPNCPMSDRSVGLLTASSTGKLSCSYLSTLFESYDDLSASKCSIASLDSVPIPESVKEALAHCGSEKQCRRKCWLLRRMRLGILFHFVQINVSESSRLRFSYIFGSTNLKVSQMLEPRITNDCNQQTTYVLYFDLWKHKYIWQSSGYLYISFFFLLLKEKFC